MAQINLLKQRKIGQGLWGFLPVLIARILMLIALAVLLFYGWLFLKQQKLTKEINNVQQQIINGQKEAESFKEKDEAFTRQAQLKELEKLIANHTYFSKLLPELAKVTLKEATYTNIKSTIDGEISLSVIVPDLQALDKFIQIFDYPKFYENFGEVRLGAFQKIQQENAVAYKFDVRMKYNTKFIK